MSNKKMDRQQIATRNMIVSVVSQVTITVLSFVNRSYFIKILGEGYLGVDGLFTSLLTMMSLAELGVGNAIIFNLYKPVAEGNVGKIKQLMKFYSSAYKYISAVVIVISLSLIPFLSKIVNLKSVTVDVNITAIFLLFLLNTCSSYFWAYKQAIIVVNQEQRVISAVQMVAKLLVVFLEIVILFTIKNYYIYLIVRVVFNYLQAFTIGVYANRKHPEVKYQRSDNLPKADKKVIINNVRALMWYKVANIFVNSTDNLMINGFTGTEAVGIFSNYTLITSAVQTLTAQLFSSLTATIGNFNATESKDKQEELFNKCVFATFLIYGLCSVCLFSLCNRFIRIVWGEYYLFDLSIVAVIVMNFYLYGFQASILIFRNTNGLFVQGKYRPLLTAFINFFVSFFLAKWVGVIGVVLGTVVARITTTTWFDPYILFKYQFRGSVKKYYLKFLLFATITVAVAFLVHTIDRAIPYTIFGWFLTLLLCLCLFTIVVIAIFGRTEEYKYIFAYGVRFIGKVLRK